MQGASQVVDNMLDDFDLAGMIYSELKCQECGTELDNTLRTPFRLSCEHSICFTCKEKRLISNNGQCPKCLKTFKVPFINQQLNNIVAIFSQFKKNALHFLPKANYTNMKLCNFAPFFNFGMTFDAQKRITSVQLGTPAAQLLKVGDLIVAINDKDVTGVGPYSFLKLLVNSMPNITLGIIPKQ